MVSQKQVSKKTIAVSIVVLIAAIGAGLVIREIHFRSVQQKTVAQAPQEVQQSNVTETPEVTPISVIQRQEPIEEIVDGQTPHQDERPFSGNNKQNIGPNNQSNNQVNNQQVEDARQWMSWFSNLPTEERQQLMRSSMFSILSLVQRWQNMPAEQVQAERAKLQELIQGWRNLPSEDRQQGIQNIQQQLEQWMQNNQQN